MMKRIKKTGISILFILSIMAVFTVSGCDNTKDKGNSQNKAEVYIGFDSKGYDKYNVKIKGKVTPEKLIDEISRITGWNLTLADKVSSGKGGMTVNFSSESALVTGPPENQKKEFMTYDVYSFTDMVLDSIKETLQQNFVQGEGNPDKLDIYYSVEGKEILVDDTVIPLDEPWSSGQNFEKQAVTVDFERFQTEQEDDSNEYAVIKGLNDNGEIVWEIETAKNSLTLIDEVMEIGIKEDKYYYESSEGVFALNLADGIQLWNNKEVRGNEFVWDDNGNLYMIGSFGPEFSAVDSNGKTLALIKSFGESYRWPSDLRIEGDKLFVTLSQDESDVENEVTCIIDRNDFSYTFEE